MEYNKLIKKICCIFLAFVFCMPLIFFTSCLGVDDDEENKPVIVIAYKPYAGSSAGFLLKTYGEEMYDNVLETSSQVLGGLIDSCGQGSLGDGALMERENNPSLNGVNIGNLLGNSSMSEDQQKTYAQQLNKMCYVSYQVVDDLPCLILSINGDNSNPTSGTKIFEYGACKIYLKENERFTFIGGNVNANNYAPTGSEGSYTFTNTINYITKLMNTNFNVIEKGFEGIDFGSGYHDGDVKDLNLFKWNWNLFNGNPSSYFTYNTINSPLFGTGYLDAYLNKYNLRFAVEVAKIKLSGEDALPNEAVTVSSEDIPSNFSISAGSYNLSTMYTTAKNGSDNDKKKFIELASVFIDHYGLTEYEATCLYDVIKTEVIGTSNFNASESSTLYKNNYDKYLAFDGVTGDSTQPMLKRVQNENKGVAALKLLQKSNASMFEDKEIDGYVKSFILYMAEDIDQEVVSMTLSIKNANTTSFNYLLMARCFHNGSFTKGYCPDVNEQLSSSNEVDVVVDEVLDQYTIGEFSSSVETEYFAYNKTEFEYDTGVYYNGWYFNKTDSGSFIEFVLASPNIYILQHFDIELVAIGFSEA